MNIYKIYHYPTASEVFLVKERKPSLKQAVKILEQLGASSFIKEKEIEINKLILYTLE